jgi:uncharacterized protein (DUF2062 family)
MVDASTPPVTAPARDRVGLLAAGVVGSVAAAFHAGSTGGWTPLLAVAMVLALAVLFVDADN